jgi:hypothetical protein
MIVSMDFVMVLADEVEEFVGREPMVGGFDEELLDEWLEGAHALGTQAGPAIGHEASGTGVAGEHAFIRQATDGLLDGIRVHTQLAADHADRRHLRARLELAGGDGFFHRTDDLFVDRLAELDLDGEGKHGAQLYDVL